MRWRKVGRSYERGQRRAYASSSPARRSCAVIEDHPSHPGRIKPGEPNPRGENGWRQLALFPRSAPGLDRRRRTAQLTTAIGVTLASLGLTACASGAQQQPAQAETSTTPQSAVEIDVCAEYGKTLYTLDTATDTGMDAGRIKAANQWGTRQLQQQALSAAGPNAENNQWAQWQAHNAKVSAQTARYDGEAPPPDTAEEHYRAAVIRPTVRGSAGWTQTLPSITVYCTLRMEHGQWRVSQAEF